MEPKRKTGGPTGPDGPGACGIEGHGGAEAGPEALGAGTSGDAAAAERLDAAAIGQELRDLNEKWLRALADLDNYRKRTERDKCRWSEQAREDVLVDLLGVMDDLDRALSSGGPGESGSGLREGVVLIRRELGRVLEKNGVVPIETEGAEFDPAFHEAVCQVESPEHDTNMIIQETQKGYRLGGRLLRCSKVVVAK